MDRRTLILSLLGGGAIAKPAFMASDTILRYPTIDYPLNYQGFHLHWSGWKASQENRWLAGQWFAWPDPLTPDSLYYYLSVPGMQGGRYVPGASFNLTMHSGDSYVYPETPDGEKDRLIWEGYHGLRDLLQRERA